MPLTPQVIADAAFWHQPLADRMKGFAELREQGPFLPVRISDPMLDFELDFRAVTRMAEVLEISRRPQDFCSGQGSTAIGDLPSEIAEFYNSFIVMDDPRHTRLRNIVSRSFTPRALQGVLDSVEKICTEVIDDFCERGEADLVEVLSQPFPLLVICDMMGIPRSEFGTVLQATNVILGAGDPDVTGINDVSELMGALLGAGMTLANLMNELADKRRKEPTDDLTSALVHTDIGEDNLSPEELAAFFILLSVAGNDTTRTAISHGVNLLSQNPDQKAIWAADVEGVTRGAVEEIVRVATPVVFMRRTVTHDVELSGEQLKEGERLVLFYGAANRDPRVFDDPESFKVQRTPNDHVGFGGPGPHFCLGAHLARRELAVVFKQLFARLPDLDLAGDPVPLQSMGVPLVGGIKQLPVRFTPTARVGV